MSSITCDIAVVGGGILGLAVALDLAPSFSVVVLEAEDRLASHQSGRNSGVAHAGLYYRPGSLKARLCREGREALEGFCEQHGIAYERRGKLVLAGQESEIPALDELERKARANGLVGIERLEEHDIRRIEPLAAGVAGLWVPQTGLVDYHRVSLVMAEQASGYGARIVTSSRVRSLVAQGPSFLLQTTSGNIGCRRVVVCAGLQSDRVARLCGLEPNLRIVPFRGEYFEICAHRRGLAHHPVYPVPDPRFPFLGVHLTPTIDGRLEAGPNAVLSLAREIYEPPRWSLRDTFETLTYPGVWRLARRTWRTAAGEMLRSASKRRFAAALARLFPSVGPGDLGSTRCGIRAQAIDRGGRLLDDFELIDAEPGLFVLNAPSPAATASLAIGQHLGKKARARLETT